ncbi:MAG: hypothetical protein ACRBBW_20870 [Cellvibrionaceae bacterium]
MSEDWREVVAQRLAAKNGERQEASTGVVVTSPTTPIAESSLESTVDQQAETQKPWREIVAEKQALKQRAREAELTPKQAQELELKKLTGELKQLSYKQSQSKALSGASASETAKAIDEGAAPTDYPQQSEEGLWNKTKDFLSGAARETRATEELPELGSDVGIEYLLGESAKSQSLVKRGALGAAMLTTFDPVETVKMLEANTDEPVSLAEDEAGNIIINVGGRLAMLNKPGFSKVDAVQLGGAATLFTPGAQLANLGKQGTVRSVLKQGTAAATTQAAAVEANQVAQGGDFSAKDTAVAGVGGSAAQALGQALSPILPWIRQKAAQSQTFGEIKELLVEAGKKLGIGADEIDDDVIKAVLASTDEKLTPNEVLAVAGEQEFGIPLTKAQRSLEDSSLSLEDSMRSGMLGDKSQRVMREFESGQQIPAINEAKENLVSKMVGDAPDGVEGEIIKESIRDAESVSSNIVTQAYSEIGDASLESASIDKLFNATRKAVIGIDKDRGLKATAGILDQLKKSQVVLSKFRSAGAKIKPMHVKQIDLLRRRINTAVDSAENQADKSQVLAMKRSFDGFMDEAVIKGLFSGDDAALQNLKSAREVFSEYAKMFRQNPLKTKSGRSIPNREGAFIERVVEANPTAEETVNAIFGASNFSNTGGARMAVKFKEIMGGDSDGWQAVRRHAIHRLIKTNKVNGEHFVSGSKTSTAIETALEKNASLVKEVFSKEELGLLKRFAAHVKRTQPDLVRSRENPSGTAQKLAAGAVPRLVDRVSAALAISGEPAMFALTTSGKVAMSFRRTGKAKDAIRPFEPVVKIRPGFVGSAGPALTGAGESAADYYE